MRKAITAAALALGAVTISAPAMAHDNSYASQHDRLHDQLDYRHDLEHEQLQDIHDEAHYYGLSRREHRRLHRQLERAHDRADHRLEHQHDDAHAYSGRYGARRW